MYNNTNEVYEPYQGFIRGNMFKNSYDNYGKVYDVKPLNEQAELLTYIDIFDFAMLDLGLYLDIYPNNQNIISLYNNIRDEKNKVMRQYEDNYGPLTLNSDALNTVPWSWNMNPWPWEV
jgi:hypothetical protein